MSPGHQRITWRRNIAENFNRPSRVHERYRQTDRRQTDGRTTTYSERKHEFTFAKNRQRLQWISVEYDWRTVSRDGWLSSFQVVQRCTTPQLTATLLSPGASCKTPTPTRASSPTRDTHRCRWQCAEHNVAWSTSLVTFTNIFTPACCD